MYFLHLQEKTSYIYGILRKNCNFVLEKVNSKKSLYMNCILLLLTAMAIAIPNVCKAQSQSLPNPLKWEKKSGEVSSLAEWNERRNEISSLIQQHEIGIIPEVKRG